MADPTLFYLQGLGCCFRDLYECICHVGSAHLVVVGGRVAVYDGKGLWRGAEVAISAMEEMQMVGWGK